MEEGAVPQEEFPVFSHGPEIERKKEEISLQGEKKASLVTQDLQTSNDGTSKIMAGVVHNTGLD